MKGEERALILGCGYVGQAVGRSLKNAGIPITAVVRTQARIRDLEGFCQKVYCSSEINPALFGTLVEENNLVIVTVAPKTRDDYFTTYLETAELFHKCSPSQPKHLIYTSSTSVYGDQGGKWVDEASPLLGSSEQAKILIQTEGVYSALKAPWKVTLLRLAEIYGPGRTLEQKIAKMGGATLAGSGTAYTNMVDLSDIVGAILYAKEHGLEGIYNLADDDHQTRAHLYQKLAKQYGYPEVFFDQKEERLFRGSKRVSNRKIKSAGYTLQMPKRN
ncbi:MAG: NAD-dependent epimerase/dehydratase family protein [Chlamydiota bacterium]